MAVADMAVADMFIVYVIVPFTYKVVCVILAVKQLQI